MDKTKPVFIVGSGRSGTQAIENILKTKVGVEVHHEYACIEVQRLAVKKHLGLIDTDTLINELKRIYLSAVRYSKKEIFVDSSNKVSWLIPELNKIFKNATFIHILRDGRKVSSSFFNKLGNEIYDDDASKIMFGWYNDGAKAEDEPPPEKRYWWNVPKKDSVDYEKFKSWDQFEKICWHWSESNLTISKYLSQIADSCKYVVKLEDLVEDKQSFYKLFEKIGIKFEDKDWLKFLTPHNVNVPKDYLLDSKKLFKFWEIAREAMNKFNYSDKEEYKVDYNKGKNLNSYCNLCKQELPLESDYTPAGSIRGLQVYICRNCSLVQSFPRIDRFNSKEKRVSSGADWGNIRYGKAFTTKKSLDIIKKHQIKQENLTILDIGSNRGSFVNEISNLFPHSYITAVEPDKTIVPDYSLRDDIKLITERIETLTFLPESFDVIYSSHTLEHLADPIGNLRSCHIWLKSNGTIYVETPNFDWCKISDVVEEFFIDKHLYHFSKDTLSAMLTLAGFEITYLEADTENIRLLAKKNSSRNILMRYSDCLKANRNNLVEVWNKIWEISKTNKIAFWGAGRIFNALIENCPNPLDGSCFILFDSYLSDFVDQSSGFNIKKPSKECLRDIDVVVVCSRQYYTEIKDQIDELNPECKVMSVFRI